MEVVDPGWTIDGANRNDSVLLAPTLDDAAGRCLLTEIDTLWLDRGYDSGVTRQRLAERQIDDAIIAKKRKRHAGEGTTSVPMGLRWPVERTNSWLSNFGQLRRNTDRRTLHRLAQFALAVAVLLTAKLILGETAGHRPRHLSAEPLRAASVTPVAARPLDDDGDGPRRAPDDITEPPHILRSLRAPNCVGGLHRRRYCGQVRWWRCGQQQPRRFDASLRARKRADDPDAPRRRAAPRRRGARLVRSRADC